jgi:hypothetical protein
MKSHPTMPTRARDTATIRRMRTYFILYLPPNRSVQLTLLLTSEARLVNAFPKFWAAEPRSDVKGNTPFSAPNKRVELPFELPIGMPNGANAPCTEVYIPPEKVAL